MKKIVLILSVILITSTYSFAQKESADKVPAVVKQAFLKKHPKATEAKWEMEKKNYEVNFILNGTKMSCNFDAKGKWIETETVITFETLPNEVKETVNSSFGDYKRIETSKVETAKEVLYEVELTKGKERLELQFTKDGKVKTRKLETAKD